MALVLGRAEKSARRHRPKGGAAERKGNEYPAAFIATPHMPGLAGSGSGLER